MIYNDGKTEMRNSVRFFVNSISTEAFEIVFIVLVEVLSIIFSVHKLLNVIVRQIQLALHRL